MGDVAIDDVFQGTSFVVTVANQEYFVGIHHGADANSKRLRWNLAEVTVEESAVGYYGVGGKGLYSCA